MSKFTDMTEFGILEISTHRIVAYAIYEDDCRILPITIENCAQDAAGNIEFFEEGEITHIIPAIADAWEVQVETENGSVYCIGVSHTLDVGENWIDTAINVISAEKEKREQLMERRRKMAEEKRRTS